MFSTSKGIYNQLGSIFGSAKNMCEFKVILNGREVFKDVVYAKVENETVTVRDVIGESKEFKNCKIVEVDVNATRLVLSKA